jgi:hypothetical protein
MLVSNVSEKD